MAGQAAPALAAVGAQLPGWAQALLAVLPRGRAAAALLTGLTLAGYLATMRSVFRPFDSSSPLWQVGACSRTAVNSVCQACVHCCRRRRVQVGELPAWPGAGPCFHPLAQQLPLTPASPCRLSGAGTPP